MAVKITNECCGCATDSHPCLGDICPNRYVKHYICDRCKDETDVLYVYEDEELCDSCLIKNFKRID